MAENPQQPQQAAVHSAVQPLSYLLGTWRGQGEGSFPTISPFKYSESFSSLTLPTSGEPMHSESGFWRPKLDGTIEVVIAQSTALVEVQKGTYDAEQSRVELKSAQGETDKSSL
ncbi:UNVERIFIED_CONTAM: UPF0678 fatty acid-binding protein-like protein [Sesamum latifolium]|uniref:UPF0678 fatty acid-binding protein-like protein n=1 Tax=Sesamum latifolium TaxID=2727402 RepID=A0AAW2TRA2_9LAMI